MKKFNERTLTLQRFGAPCNTAGKIHRRTLSEPTNLNLLGKDVESLRRSGVETPGVTPKGQADPILWSRFPWFPWRRTVPFYSAPSWHRAAFLSFCCAGVIALSAQGLFMILWVKEPALERVLLPATAFDLSGGEENLDGLTNVGDVLPSSTLDVRPAELLKPLQKSSCLRPRNSSPREKPAQLHVCLVGRAAASAPSEDGHAILIGLAELSLHLSHPTSVLLVPLASMSAGAPVPCYSTALQARRSALSKPRD